MTSNIAHKNLLYKQVHFEILNKLYKSSYTNLSSADEVYDLIIEHAVQGLNIDRAGYWQISNNKLVCKSLFDRESGFYVKGSSIESREIPNYISALDEGIAVVVNDVNTDKHTQELLDSYLKPLGITDILDIPVRKNGVLSGVFCCEHRDDPREWSESDLAFSKALCDVLTLMLEQLDRRQIELQFREYEKKIHLITNNSKEWFMVFENNKLTYKSPPFSDFFDINKETAKNYSLEDFFKNFHDEDRFKCERIVKESIDKKIETIRYVYRVKSNKSKKYHWRQDSLTVLYDYKKIKENNKYVIVSRDITDLKRAERKVETLYKVLKKLNEKILDFTHIVSHNIRSDASNISMLVDMITDTKSVSEKEKYLKLLKQSNTKLFDTIHKLNETIETDFLSKKT